MFISRGRATGRCRSRSTAWSASSPGRRNWSEFAAFAILFALPDLGRVLHLPALPGRRSRGRRRQGLIALRRRCRPRHATRASASNHGRCANRIATTTISATASMSASGLAPDASEVEEGQHGHVVDGHEPEAADAEQEPHRDLGEVEHERQQGHGPRGPAPERSRRRSRSRRARPRRSATPRPARRARDAAGRRRPLDGVRTGSQSSSSRRPHRQSPSSMTSVSCAPSPTIGS